MYISRPKTFAVLYRFLKFLIFWASKVYFRKLYFFNREKIPRDKRLIFAVNHPSAFLDAIIPAVHMSQVYYFLVRGDIYGNKWVRKLLFALHTIPIFRFRDGFRRMRNNQASFDRAYQILERGKQAMMIMAEGGNSERKQLLPLQKGAARLAFGAYEAKKLADLAIVPVGVNYTDVWRFRSDVMVSFGDPLFIADYLDAYGENPRKTVTQLTRDLEKAMRREVVQIDRAEDERWANPLLDIAREGEGQEGALDREFERIARINAMAPETREACAVALKRYEKRLSDTGLRYGIHKPASAFYIKGLGYFLGTLPFGLAWLLHAPPLLFSHWLIKKMVPSPIFFPSIRFTSAMFIWLFYWIALSALSAVALAKADFIALLLLWFVMLFLGFYALPFFEGFSRWRDAFRMRRLKPELKQDLHQIRAELLAYISP